MPIRPKGGGMRSSSPAGNPSMRGHEAARSCCDLLTAGLRSRSLRGTVGFKRHGNRFWHPLRNIILDRSERSSAQARTLSQANRRCVSRRIGIVQGLSKEMTDIVNACQLLYLERYVKCVGSRSAVSSLSIPACLRCRVPIDALNTSAGPLSKEPLSVWPARADTDLQVLRPRWLMADRLLAAPLAALPARSPPVLRFPSINQDCGA